MKVVQRNSLFKVTGIGLQSWFVRIILVLQGERGSSLKFQWKQHRSNETTGHSTNSSSRDRTVCAFKPRLTRFNDLLAVITGESQATLHKVTKAWAGVSMFIGDRGRRKINLIQSKNHFIRYCVNGVVENHFAKYCHVEAIFQYFDRFCRNNKTQYHSRFSTSDCDGICGLKVYPVSNSEKVIVNCNNTGLQP